MHRSLFFKLFPPPKYMIMNHAGLDISDDAIHFLEYSRKNFDIRISKYSSVSLPENVISSGEVKDEKTLRQIVSDLAHKQGISYVKVSIPEEKAYLFQTDISTTDPLSAAQNIEFKLEENVPLSVNDALFYFDILPMAVTGGKLRASVSVVPRIYVENIANILRGAGITPVAFEVVPKSISRAVLPSNQVDTVMLVQMFNNKTSIYIVAGGVVCFTSTIAWSSANSDNADHLNPIITEIERINEYWLSHHSENSKIIQMILVGRNSIKYESSIKNLVSKLGFIVSIGNVWTNVFPIDNYVPPILKEDSLDYSVTAGLALGL